MLQRLTSDLAFMPTMKTSIHAFASTEKLDSDQDARAFSGTAKLTQSADPRRNWTATHRDDVDSLGLGFTHAVIKNKFDIGADYVYSKSKGAIDLTTGSALDSEPLPDLNTKLHSFTVYGKYKIKPDMYLKLRYWYEKYDSNDWALDGVAVNELANVITLGDTSPDYDVHTIVLSFLYKFK